MAILYAIIYGIMELWFLKIGKITSIKIHINVVILTIIMVIGIIILHMLCKMQLMDVFQIKIIITILI